MMRSAKHQRPLSARLTRALAWLPVLGLACLSACSSVAGDTDVTSDESLRDHVVGRWVVARNSADYMSLSAREEYRPDGTYTMLFFDDPECNKIIGELDASWTVTQGVLSLEVTQVSARRFGRVGDVTRDRILAFSSDTFTLQPTRWLLALNTHYVRRRSEGCTAASATKAT